MNLLSGFPLLTRLKGPRQVISNSWSDRDNILKSDINLFCWKRDQSGEMTSYLQELLKGKLEPLAFYSTSAELKDNLEKHRRVWDAKLAKEGDMFWKDVYQLTFDFLAFSAHSAGSVLIKVIDDDACTKFHTDGYSMRLFTTYHGLGTEWLPEKVTNRRGLGKSNELIVKDADQIQRMDSFEVGILKGEIPNRPNRTPGIVHRSPEISSPEEKRIILRVDL